VSHSYLDVALQEQDVHQVVMVAVQVDEALADVASHQWRMDYFLHEEGEVNYLQSDLGLVPLVLKKLMKLMA
jgi:hypothetical protein